MSKAKRCDLQYWRAFAIFAVLAIHIWPKCFPNGYLGVDIFFVISGFLMAQILGKSEKITFSSALSFYHRRLRRIAPVYLVFSLGCLVFLYFSLLPTDFATTVIDSRWASIFAANVQSYLKKSDYFDFNKSFNFYLHAWSLAVEVQIYIILPAVFALWINTTPAAKYPILGILSIGSFFLQLTSNPKVAYINPAARFWQFSIGFLARDYMPLGVPNFVKIILLLIVSGITFFPVITLSRDIASTVTIVATGILVSSPTPDLDERPFSSLLMLGDISYVLYLIHWPIVVYARYLIISDGTDDLSWTGFVITVVSVSLAYVFHKKIEIPLLNLCQGKSYVAVVLIVIFGALHTGLPFFALKHPVANLDLNSRPEARNLYYAAQNFTSPLTIPPKWSRHDEIAVTLAMNRAQCVPWNLGCVNETRPFSNVRFCETQSNTSVIPKTAVVLGNSHAVCFSPIVHKLFSSVTTVGVYSCPFPPEAALFKRCKPGWDLGFETVEKVKPDIVFFVNMYFGLMWKPIFGNVGDDRIVNSLNSALKHISNFTDAIIVTTPAVIMNDPDVGATFARARWNDMFINFKVTRQSQTKKTNVQKRFDAIDCPKCHYLNLADIFCGENFCDGIDRQTMLPMWRDRTHLNMFGLRKLFPYVDHLVENLYQ